MNALAQSQTMSVLPLLIMKEHIQALLVSDADSLCA